MFRPFLFCLFALGLGCATASVSSAASNYIVRTTTTNAGVSWIFSPSNTTLLPGDTITWTNAHNVAHDTTAGVANSGTNNGWASPLLTNTLGQTFAFAFTNPGTFPYRCRRHTDTGATTLHPEQTGVVTVVAPNMPPTVALTNPVNGSAFVAPAAFTLQATATDDGSVTNVQFRSGATPLGNDTNAPFTLLVTNLAAGNYIYTAVATDNAGLLATSAPVGVFVLTNSEITKVQLLAGGQAVLSVLGIAGQTYFIDATTNLSNWQTLVTSVPAADSFTFTNTNASSFPARLYRSRQVAP